MLVELGLVEQRYKAVLEVLDGATVVDVAVRNGVVRQTVHDWLRRYGRDGLAGLVDGSPKPQSCPHQMAPEVEAAIVELRRAHPGWGPRTIGHPRPRALVDLSLPDPPRPDHPRSPAQAAQRLQTLGAGPGHGAVAAGHRRRRGPHRRAGGQGRHRHRRPLPVLRLGLRGASGHGPAHLRRPGPGHAHPRGARADPHRQRQGLHRPLWPRHRRGPLRPHLPGERDPPHPHRPPLPPTTGKVERFHKTLRAEFLTGQEFATIEEAQAALDAWVHHYNHERPHQSIGMVAPFERFRLAAPQPVETPAAPVPGNEPASARTEASPAAPNTTRRVGANGLISFASAKYRAGVWLAGQDITVVCDGGLVQLHHRGVLIATHARRHSVDKQGAGLRRAKPAKGSVRRPTPTAAPVTRKVDSSGNVCFAGSSYRAGAQFRRRQVQVAVVGDMVEISIGNELIRCYPVKHDRTREHGALANPGGRPRRINAA